MAEFYLGMIFITAITIWWADRPYRVGEWVAFVALAATWPLMVGYLIYYLAKKGPHDQQNNKRH